VSEKISYYDAARRISVLQLRVYSAVESGDFLAAAAAGVRHVVACWDPRLTISFWRSVLAKGVAETFEDGMRGALDGMVEEWKPGKKEARWQR